MIRLVIVDWLTKVLLVLIAAAVWANALALWTGARAATAAAPNVIKAQQFIVVDQNGNERATLGLSFLSQSPELRLRAEGEEKDGVHLEALPGGRSSLWLGGKNGSMWLGTMWRVTDSGRSMVVSATGPHVSLFDKDGRVRAVLGAVDLPVPKTGEQKTRSPSSLVLFGPDRTVVWKAP